MNADELVRETVRATCGVIAELLRQGADVAEACPNLSADRALHEVADAVERGVVRFIAQVEARRDHP